ncbi:hypothetical protein FQN60_013011 [Etheostoma spectabile]|uniref:UBX domain-containing protein n=1 Tax=Etheostoma spectabile TaxID=54343 RepID=A0A5J5DAK1_9PERO|nr:hypothetical protein FQN60_013011 [Etheostoma spectabile]
MLAALAKTGFVKEGCNKNFGYLQKLWQGIVVLCQSTSHQPVSTLLFLHHLSPSFSLWWAFVCCFSDAALTSDCSLFITSVYASPFFPFLLYSSAGQPVKRNVSDLTNIPVRHQQWEGWPVSASDDSSRQAALVYLNIRRSHRHPTMEQITGPLQGTSSFSASYHTLPACPASALLFRCSLSQKNDASCLWDQLSLPSPQCLSKVLTSNFPGTHRGDVHMVSDSEGDDFEDASEFGVDDSEMFGMGSSTCRKSPMMPENSENEADALLHFTAEFSSRYGETHPMFFIGSLEAASQEAFHGKARDILTFPEAFFRALLWSVEVMLALHPVVPHRKLLAIYLHNDDSVLGNVFCSQMMCADSIVAYLSQNFITWAWDVTKEANKARLLTMCTRHFGSVVTQTIRTYKTDQFPLLLIVMGKRTSNEVLNVIQGNTTVDELMMRLMGAMEIFTAQQQEDIKDEDEREARETVKREQDEAYRVSLEADRKKREAQEREEAEQVRLERMRKEQEEEKEAIRLSLEQALPPEPEDSGEQISKLRIRTPSGEFLERRFHVSCKLQVLFDFVASKGYPFEEFKLLTTFPRRNSQMLLSFHRLSLITQLDPGSNLMEAKLFPQETLFLESKE